MIAFDIHFTKARDAPGTQALSQAIREAGNVVLTTLLDDLETFQSPRLPPGAGAVKETPPIPELAEAAAVLAPFPLPRTGNVQLFWLFSPEAGDRLTCRWRPYSCIRGPCIPRSRACSHGSAGASPTPRPPSTASLRHPISPRSPKGCVSLLIEHPALKEALIRWLRRDGSANPRGSRATHCADRGLRGAGRPAILASTARPRPSTRWTTPVS